MYDIAENTHERARALLLINSNLPPPPPPPSPARPTTGGVKAADWVGYAPSLSGGRTDEGDVASHRETEKCVPGPKGRRRREEGRTQHTVLK